MQIRFGPFVLDFETRQLTRDGREQHLSPKAFELLAALIQDRPRALSNGSRRYPLYPGEHVVGRDPGVEIRLDAASVSRRHARLIVTADGTTLEDFDSKNGTWRGAERLTSPVHLANGDEIRIGSQLVTYYVRGADSTETLMLEAR